jgi:hypothetical protein
VVLLNYFVVISTPVQKLFQNKIVSSLSKPKNVLKLAVKLKQPMKFTFAKSFCAILFLSLGLWSCGPTSKEDKSSSEELKDAEESLKDEIENVVYNIPSPHEIPYLLQSTGADFNQSLLSDRKKAESYLTKTDKVALNLGVYASDIGYLSSYDKTQEAINYLSTAKSLADNLGVIGSFDSDILKNFEANISNKDSLAAVLDRAIQKTGTYLKDDSRNKLAALTVTGSFVEGLYITTGVISSYPKNLLPNDQRNIILTPLIRIILDQEKSVNELIKMLGTVKPEEEPINSILADLTSLQSYYKALNIEDQIKNNKGNEVLNDKNLAEITKLVTKLRKSITD